MVCTLSSIIFSFLYASLDEYHQTFTPGRGGRIGDIIIDSIGAAFGCLAIFFIVFNKKKTKNTVNSKKCRINTCICEKNNIK